MNRRCAHTRAEGICVPSFDAATGNGDRTIEGSIIVHKVDLTRTIAHDERAASADRAGKIRVAGALKTKRASGGNCGCAGVVVVARTGEFQRGIVANRKIARTGEPIGVGNGASLVEDTAVGDRKVVEVKVAVAVTTVLVSDVKVEVIDRARIVDGGVVGRTPTARGHGKCVLAGGNPRERHKHGRGAVICIRCSRRGGYGGASAIVDVEDGRAIGPQVESLASAIGIPVHRPIKTERIANLHPDAQTSRSVEESVAGGKCTEGRGSDTACPHAIVAGAANEPAGICSNR